MNSPRMKDREKVGDKKYQLKDLKCIKEIQKKKKKGKERMT